MNGQRRQSRFSLSIVGCVHRPDPASLGAWKQLLDLRWLEHARGDAVRTAATHPVLVPRQRVCGPNQLQVSPLAPPDVATGLLLQRGPHGVGVHHQRDLCFVAALLTDETPVPRGLLRANGGFLEDDRAKTAPGQRQGGGASRDAATDDHGVGGAG